jgi:hypothetical protein
MTTEDQESSPLLAENQNENQSKGHQSKGHQDGNRVYA